MSINPEHRSGAGHDKPVYRVGVSYTTDTRETPGRVLPPGPAPDGYKWSSRKDRYNGFIRRWSLRSTSPAASDPDAPLPVGSETRTFESSGPKVVILQKGEMLSLHKPPDVGIPDWQKQDLGDD